MRRDGFGCVGIGADVVCEDMFAVGRLREVGAVGLAAEPVPFGGEYTTPADLLERKPQPADLRRRGR